MESEIDYRSNHLAIDCAQYVKFRDNDVSRVVLTLGHGGHYTCELMSYEPGENLGFGYSEQSLLEAVANARTCARKRALMNETTVPGRVRPVDEAIAEAVSTSPGRGNSMFSVQEFATIINRDTRQVALSHLDCRNLLLGCSKVVELSPVTGEEGESLWLMLPNRYERSTRID